MEGITKASAVQPRERLVELEDLKTAEGAPVAVLCLSVSEIALLEITQRIPAPSPQVGPDAERDAIQEASSALAYADPLIEIGTALAGENGALIRPAFSRENPPPPGSLPMRWLSDASKLRLFDAICGLTGVLGKAAEAVSFRHEDGAGLGAGDGAGRDGSEVREDAEPAPIGGA